MAGAALFAEELCAEIAVAVHVRDVGGERGVGVVDEVAVECGRGACEVDDLMDGAGCEACLIQRPRKRLRRLR